MAHRISRAAAGVLALAGLAHAAAGQQTVYAIGDGGASLIRFDSSNPGAVTVVGTFNGAANFLDAIDFRPATGQLYGYLDNGDTFFTVNTATAALTSVSQGASAFPTNTFQLGLDFNPGIDRARILTDSGQNIVFNPNTGTVTTATALAYAASDVNADASPAIIDNAYSQNYIGSASTLQYAIDYGLDALVRVDNNAGTLTTVGPLGVATDIYTGFDIVTANGVDTAYAILTPPGLGGSPAFYTINLTTGAATLVGAIGSLSNQVYSLAVVPAPGAALLAAALAWPARRRR